MRKLGFLFGLLLVAVPVIAWACTQPQITLCHATHSEGNPFNLITVDADAVFKQGHDQHQDGEDIIPAFTYYVNEKVGDQHRHKSIFTGWTGWSAGTCHYEWWASKCEQRDVMGDVEHSYPGKNLTTLYGWGATGAEVLANGCNVPPPPYTTCDETVPGTTYDVGDPVWGPWTFNESLGVMERFGTQATFTPLVDSKDGGTCPGGTPGSRDLYESEKYEYCKTTNTVYGSWSDPVWNPDLGAYVRTRTVTFYDALDTDFVCESLTEDDQKPMNRCAFNSALPIDSDELKRQDYGLGELWGPDGQYATMYIYPDKDGYLPIGIGVQRQLCVLGWEAVRSGYFGFVYQDSCTGDYIWKGVIVTPRPDVLKHGVCARGGACIVE